MRELAGLSNLCGESPTPGHMPDGAEATPSVSGEPVVHSLPCVQPVSEADVTSCAFDLAPSRYMALEHIQAGLGLRSRHIAALLLANRFLRDQLDTRLRALLDPLPQDLPIARAALFSHITMSTEEELAGLSRKITVLINHQAILRATDGALLTRVIDWCGMWGQIDIIREGGLPRFGRLSVLSGLSQENFELYSLKVQGYLLGMLPQAYLQRLHLRVAPGRMPEPMRFAHSDPDHGTFMDYALMAHSVTSGKRSVDASH